MHLLSVLIADWQISPESNPESRPKLRIETGPMFGEKRIFCLKQWGMVVSSLIWVGSWNVVSPSRHRFQY